METKEVWKPIIGFEDYMANSRGEVKSYKTSVPKMKKYVGSKKIYTLFDSNGKRYCVCANRIAYSFLNDKNPTKIDGVVIGSTNNLQLISKEEFFTFIRQKAHRSKKINEDEVCQLYSEAFQNIIMIRQFYQSGDINDIAKSINRYKANIISYVMRKGICLELAREIWSTIQEKCLIGIAGKKLVVLNIRLYLLRMAKAEIVSTKKEVHRSVSYNENYLYGIME